MSYTSKIALDNAIGTQTVIELTDDAGAGSVDVTHLNAAITDADRLIDGYCQAHWSVPFDGATPPIIAAVATSLAAWFLYRRRRSSFGMPEDIREDYKDAIRTLEKLNKGSLDLGVEPTKAKGAKVVAQYSGPDQEFTSAKLGEF